MLMNESERISRADRGHQAAIAHTGGFVQSPGGQVVILEELWGHYFKTDTNVIACSWIRVVWIFSFFFF